MHNAGHEDGFVDTELALHPLRSVMLESDTCDCTLTVPDESIYVTAF